MNLLDLYSRDLCHVCGQTPCNCTHVAESADPQSRKLGRIISRIYNEIYDMGDDALDYLNDRAAVWAELWDRYEGDIDSIIAEEDPVTLGKAALELKDILNDLQSDQGVAEGSDFGAYYYEQLAQQTFDINPNLTDENEILNLGYKIAKGELGSRAQGMFRDEDFPSDFVSAYGYLKKQGVAEGLNEISADLISRARDAAGRKWAAADDRGDKKASKKYNAQDSRLTDRLNAKKSKEQGVAEADKHSMLGKIQRHQELKKKVDTSFADIGKAQQAGDHPAASKAFRKHERYANLERPGTWTKVDEQGVAEEKVRLDPKCWSGKKIGNPKTKIKGGVRVNNCVPAESVAEMRNTDDPIDDMVEDYLDWLESVGMLDKSREEEKASVLAGLESGVIHPSEIEYALSGTKWDPLAEVSDKTLIDYLNKVHADSQKHDRDPTKRSAEKRNKSVAGFSRAFNKLDARKEPVNEIDPNNYDSDEDYYRDLEAGRYQGVPKKPYNPDWDADDEEFMQKWYRERGLEEQGGLGFGENQEKEADYGKSYQDMVKRMGAKAREQEQSRPVDIGALARKLRDIEHRSSDK